MKKKQPDNQQSNIFQLIHWVEKQGKQILIAFATLLVLVLVLFRVSGGTKQTYTPFIQGEQLLSQIENGEENLDTLNQLLQQRPELHPHYDGKIAQFLIGSGEMDQARSFATLAEQRTEEEGLALYRDFSTTTWLICQEQYEPALEKALSLKEKLTEARKQTPSSYDRLHAFNLIRIAALQQQCNQKEQELETWKEWKAFTNSQEINYPGGNLNASTQKEIMRHFENGQVSFDTYVAHRESN